MTTNGQAPFVTLFLNLEKDANAMSLEESAPFDPKDIPSEESSVNVDDNIHNSDDVINSKDESDMSLSPISEEDELLDIFE